MAYRMVGINFTVIFNEEIEKIESDPDKKAIAEILKQLQIE